MFSKRKKLDHYAQITTWKEATIYKIISQQQRRPHKLPFNLCNDPTHAHSHIFGIVRQLSTANLFVSEFRIATAHMKHITYIAPSSWTKLKRKTVTLENINDINRRITATPPSPQYVEHLVNKPTLR